MLWNGDDDGDRPDHGQRYVEEQRHRYRIANGYVIGPTKKQFREWSGLRIKRAQCAEN